MTVFYFKSNGLRIRDLRMTGDGRFASPYEVRSVFFSGFIGCLLIVIDGFSGPTETVWTLEDCSSVDFIDL